MRYLAILIGAFGFVNMAVGQAVKDTLTEKDAPPPLTYRGVIPGRTQAPEVREKLGSPDIEAQFYSHKMLYASETRPGQYDSIQLLGSKDGTVTAVEAATIPDDVSTDAKIRAKLGSPEYELKLLNQSMLDYSEKGARFVVDQAGQTVGIAYFTHLRTRVHDGAVHVVDLSGLPAAPPKASAGKPDFSEWKAGAAEIVITPTVKGWLATDKWELHDDLKARICYLTNGKTTVTLVGADLFGMSHGIIKDYIAAVAKIGGGHMILGMSHNHAAPDTIGVYGHFPKEYIAYIGEQIVKGVAQAKAAARPVGAVHAASKEMLMIGARVPGWFRNARNPGVLDPQIAAIKIDDDKGKTIATIVNFACHVEGLSAGFRDMSADFPGYMCDQIGENLGGICVFLNGAVGGMVSGDTQQRTHEEAKKVGLELADELTQLAKTAPSVGGNALIHVRRRIEVPTTNSRFLAFAGLMEAAGRAGLNRGRTVTEMNYLQIGTAQFCTIPGELLPEISFEIQTVMKGYPRLIVGLANDQVGYIIPAEDFRASGKTDMAGWAYEETMSLGPAAGPIIKEYAKGIIRDNQHIDP